MELANGNLPLGGTPGSDHHLWIGTSCPYLALDHFQCYKVRELSSVGDASVSLRDQFGSEEARVQKAETICTPVNKNGEGIKHFSFHLVCYDLRGAGKVGVAVNQWAGLAVRGL